MLLRAWPCISRHLGEKTTGFSGLHKLTPAETLKAKTVIFKRGYNGKSQYLKSAVGKGLLHNPINVSIDEVIIMIKDKNKEERRKKGQNEPKRNKREGRKDTWRGQ